MLIKKAVIPAGGIGTRFLPTSKTVPKELLPLFDKPLIHHVVEEAQAAGIQQIILVTSPGKEALTSYFKPDPSLNAVLIKRGAIELHRSIQDVECLAQISYVEQKEPMGLGHAILISRELVGDEPFAVILPDDIIRASQPTIGTLMKLYSKNCGGVIAVEEVPTNEIGNYGIIDPCPLEDQVCEIKRLVEKPTATEAPSNLGIVGRYVLHPNIFDCLEKTKPGVKGEIQLTDGLNMLLKSHALYAYQFPGVRYDGGTPLGLLKASLAIALEQEDTRLAILDALKDHLSTRPKL